MNTIIGNLPRLASPPGRCVRKAADSNREKIGFSLNGILF